MHFHSYCLPLWPFSLNMIIGYAKGALLLGKGRERSKIHIKLATYFLKLNSLHTKKAEEGEKQKRVYLATKHPTPTPNRKRMAVNSRIRSLKNDLLVEDPRETHICRLHLTLTCTSPFSQFTNPWWQLHQIFLSSSCLPTLHIHI
jgi:hypothetical protein